MTSSVSKFWFEIDEGNGSTPALVDNDGAGLFIKQDTVLFDRVRSSRSRTGSPDAYDLVIVVRRGGLNALGCEKTLSAFFGRYKLATRRPRFPS